MAERIETDVLIVGAGIAGAGLAADLASTHRVVVAEMEERAGYHTTGRSAALFIQNYGNAAIRALSRASAPLFRNADRSVFGTPLLSPRGMLTVADTDSLAQHRALLDQAEGLRPISPREAVTLVPILDESRIAEASFEPDAQDIDVAALHQGWLRIAKSRGATFLLKAPVESGERMAGRWRVQAGGVQVDAAVVVDAAGAWADAVAARCGVAPLGLRPMRRTLAVIPCPEGYDCSSWPLFDDAAEGWYAKPETGRLLVSPADEVPVEPHDAFVDDLVLAEGLDRYARAVTVPVTRVERSWAGLRTFAPDRTPVAGFDAAADGFFWLAGQGGYGIQTAPALSALAAQLIRRAPPPETLAAVVSSLSPHRFGARRPS